MYKLKPNLINKKSIKVDTLNENILIVSDSNQNNTQYNNYNIIELENSFLTENDGSSKIINLMLISESESDSNTLDNFNNSFLITQQINNEKIDYKNSIFIFNVFFDKLLEYFPKISELTVLVNERQILKLIKTIRSLFKLSVTDALKLTKFKSLSELLINCEITLKVINEYPNIELNIKDLEYDKKLIGGYYPEDNEILSKIPQPETDGTSAFGGVITQLDKSKEKLTEMFETFLRHVFFSVNSNKYENLKVFILKLFEIIINNFKDKFINNLNIELNKYNIFFNDKFKIKFNVVQEILNKIINNIFLYYSNLEQISINGIIIKYESINLIDIITKLIDINIYEFMYIKVNSKNKIINELLKIKKQIKKIYELILLNILDFIFFYILKLIPYILDIYIDKIENISKKKKSDEFINFKKKLNENIKNIFYLLKNKILLSVFNNVYDISYFNILFDILGININEQINYILDYNEILQISYSLYKYSNDNNSFVIVDKFKSKYNQKINQLNIIKYEDSNLNKKHIKVSKTFDLIIGNNPQISGSQTGGNKHKLRKIRKYKSQKLKYTGKIYKVNKFNKANETKKKNKSY